MSLIGEVTVLHVTDLSIVPQLQRGEWWVNLNVTTREGVLEIALFPLDAAGKEKVAKELKLI